MAVKVKLTEELSQVLKNTRNNNEIKSEDLAKYINRSVPFISKLENKKAEKIDLDILIKIFEFFIKKSKFPEDFIKKLLDKTLIEFSPEEVRKQQWFQIFDLEIRKFMIPDSLIILIKDKLNRIDVSLDQAIIKMNLDEEIRKILTEILNRNCIYVNYITMQEIIKTFYKLENYSEDEISMRTSNILEENGFITSIKNNELFRKEKRNEKLNVILNKYDDENIIIINKLMKHISILSDWNIDYVNEKLSDLNDSFDMDSSFILAIIGNKFSKLRTLKKEDRKRFLYELSSLIDKFANISSEYGKDFELY